VDEKTIDAPHVPTATTLSKQQALLPFKKADAVWAGAGLGAMLRIAELVGISLNSSGQLLNAAIGLVPLAVGAFTVYLAERQERRSWCYYAVASFLANFLFITGLCLAMIEFLFGLVLIGAVGIGAKVFSSTDFLVQVLACILVVAPAFGASGGLLMGVVCRMTGWPEGTPFNVLLSTAGNASPEPKQ
jgi:hypothetical protein